MLFKRTQPHGYRLFLLVLLILLTAHISQLRQLVPETKRSFKLNNVSVFTDAEDLSRLDIAEQILLDMARHDPSSRYWPEQTWRALRYIATVQNPYHCNTTKLVRISVDAGGGMGSKLQIVAKKLAMALNNNWTIVTEGDMGGYTAVPECRGLGWTCLFQPISRTCQTIEHIGRSQLVPLGEFGSMDDVQVPNEIMFSEDADANRAFWWSAVHLYLFRLSNLSQAHVDAVESKMRWSWDPQVVHVGMHIRQGDKQSDWSGQTAKYGSDPDHYLHELARLLEQVKPRAQNRVQVFFATDSIDVAAAVTKSWPRLLAEILAGKLDPSISAASPWHDNVQFLLAPANATLSLSASKAEMMQQVEKYPDLALMASLEVLADIYFLARSNVYYGLCMSQPTRFAVNIGHARGHMQDTFAMDWPMADYRDFLKLGLPEGWKQPPGYN